MKRQRLLFTAILILCGLLTATVGAEEPLLPAGRTSMLFDSLTRFKDAESHRESSSNENLKANGDARSIEIGETLVLGEMEGPGVITHIWTTVGSVDPFHGNSLVVRIYWDGAEHPSVEAPLGDFFGVGHGAQSSFSSLPVATSSDGRARSCFWHMPFEKKALVTVTNESKQYRCDSFYYYLDWHKVPRLPEDTAYFHARYRQAMPAGEGDYTILETSGRGHYVGTVYSVHQTKLGWFGEGDDWFFIDGEETPSLRGTGTEDYFGDAWGFREFSRPFYGVSLWEGYFPGDRVSAYRWHLTDPVYFRKSLKVAIEHRGSIFNEKTGLQTKSFFERPDWIRSVAFWYQSPPTTFSEELPAADQRIAPYRVFQATDLPRRVAPKGLLTAEKMRVMYVPRKGDAEIEFDFELDTAGTYQINAFLFYSVFGSRYQAYLDDTPLGEPLDFYRSGADSVWTRFDLHRLEAGTHTLRFAGRGASPGRRTLTPNYFAFGMDYLVLLRLEDMAGYGKSKSESQK